MQRQGNQCARVGGVLVATLSLLLVGGPADAAGLLIADGGFGGVLEIEEHEVDVTLNNGIAVTEVTQVFRNTEKRQVEALYTFPVPKGASVANFSMWIGGKEMIGEVLEKKRAREIYESYKRRRVDPGLLEQVDYKTFEMRIFPIGPEATQKVRVTYYQEVDVDNDWATYVYPLATVTREGVDARTTGKFTLNVKARSAVQIVSMESPSHVDDFAIADHSPNFFEASLETSGGDLSRDAVIAYKLSRPKTGIDLIASKRAGEDGYFYATLTVGEDLSRLERGMDYVFVLDVSGSMRFDGKMRLSRNSIAAFINELDENDRFEMVTFNIRPNVLFREMTPVSADSVERAVEYLDSQEARGGTTLSSAIRAAYKYGTDDRVLNVVVLSDGLTEGNDSATLTGLIPQSPPNARVFCIGVGNDVNRRLLKSISEGAGGLAAFISRGDNFERQAKAFRRKLVRPAVTDVGIEFDGVEVYDMAPREIPNIYHGAPLRLYGRYQGQGRCALKVTGEINGKRFAKDVSVKFPERDSDNPQVDRMWAWHRIDDLLKATDGGRRPPPIIDEIVALGEDHSIVTEYTSFLVLENDQEYQRWKIERRNVARLNRDRQARQKVADDLRRLRDQAIEGIGPALATNSDSAPTAPTAESLRGAIPPQITRSAESPRPESRESRQEPRRRRILDGVGGNPNSGGGPVGPLFVGMAAWLMRRKRQLARREEA